MAVEIKCFMKSFYSGKPCENEAITQCLVYYDQYTINACADCVKYYENNPEKKFSDLKIKPSFNSDEEERIYKDLLKDFEFISSMPASKFHEIPKSQRDEIFFKSYRDLKIVKEKYKTNFQIIANLGAVCRATVPFNWIGDRFLFDNN